MPKKKKKEIIIGTNNKGKLREIKDLIPKSYQIFSPKEYGYRSPKENGNSFLKNSLIKAKYYSKKSGKICIADDSGLEIYALNKKPGVFSARWAGKKDDFNFGQLLAAEEKSNKFRKMMKKCVMPERKKKDDDVEIDLDGNIKSKTQNKDSRK